jgi:hypothetical protein
MISIADAFLHDTKKWDIALIQGLVDDNTVTKILKNGIYLVCSSYHHCMEDILYIEHHRIAGNWQLV